MSDPSRLQHDHPSALASGTRLGEFELRGLLGVGGFGIVYLAFDHALEREVAIKEYMPASLAGRTETLHVSIRSQSDAESFALGLKSFVNEAKLLARFDHPSLLKVLRFWEANGTAYMAMPVLRGRTLKQIRQEMGGPPDEAWLRGVLVPLLGAIDTLHAEGVYHRDIAPDNIQIEPDGRPVLMDFGAARRVLVDKSQMLTAILKPAYAPIEQYGEAGAVKQGPWTDLYALGATLHYLLLGRPPPPATARAVHDEASALTVQQLPGCSEAFLGAIDWMLSPRPTDRPQSVADLREVLAGRASAPPRRAVEQAPVHWERTRVLVPGGEGADFSAERAEAPTQRIDSTVRAAATSEHVWLEPDASVRATGPVAAASGRVPPPAGRPAWLLPLGLLAVACAVAAVVFWPSPASVPEAAATSPAPAAVAPAATEAIPAAAASAVTTGAAVAVDLPAPPVVGAPGSLPIKTSEAAPAVSAKPAAPRPVAARPPLEAAAPRPDTASPPADVGAAAGPPPACGASTGVRYHVCMERECGTAAFAAHPSCQRWKQDARRD